MEHRIKQKLSFVSIYTQGMFCIAAKHNDDIVGNIVITIKNDTEGESYGVDDLFVVKAWRSFGIGKTLLLSAFSELRNQGIKESRLEVWSDNKRGLSVYSNVGYKFYKQTECAIGIF